MSAEYPHCRHCPAGCGWIHTTACEFLTCTAVDCPDCGGSGTISEPEEPDRRCGSCMDGKVWPA